ncbi:MAG TPA: MFS transporter [Methylomirabilota bacterium]|nr:MFS transporter [Methylomirabilota bacterium]
MKPRPRAVLATASVIHFLHDGFSETLYVFLPLWASEFGLSFSQVGLIRSAYTGGMSAFQIPAGFLAERIGERWLLAAGTAVTALGFVAAGWAGGFVGLLVLLLCAGLGSGVQHPLSSSIVSKAYEDRNRRTALGTYNFSGDIGKAGVAAAIGLLAGLIGWRAAGATYGVIGVVAAFAIVPMLSRLGAGGPEPRGETDRARSSGWGIRDGRGFGALCAIGMIDNATRTGFLTFMPFILMAKGLGVGGVGLAFALVFAGGATGKFVCGVIADRVGVIRTVVITEALTTVFILTVVAAPLPIALAVLIPLGVALNGTSSVLYGTVADLVSSERRSRAYGLYYTVTIAASAAAPTVWGLVGDLGGVPITLSLVSIAVLATIPLCLVLRPAVAPVNMGGPDMAPQTPQRSGRPGKAVPPLDTPPR